MRRVVAVVTGFVLTGVLAGSVLAAQNGHIVSASGWRLSPDGVPTVQFQASAQISPGNALGTYRFGNAGYGFSAVVTCGDVDGDIAVIGGRLTDGSGANFLVWLIDNGSPTFGNWGPDQVSTTDVGGGTSGTEFGVYPDLPDDFPAHCPPAAGAGFDQVVADGALRTVIGDIIVH